MNRPFCPEDLIFLGQAFREQQSGLYSGNKIDSLFAISPGYYGRSKKKSKTMVVHFFLGGRGGDWGVDKVHYGLCKNGEFPKQSHSAIRHHTQPRAQGFFFLPFFLREKPWGLVSSTATNGPIYNSLRLGKTKISYLGSSQNIFSSHMAKCLFSMQSRN